MLFGGAALGMLTVAIATVAPTAGPRPAASVAPVVQATPAKTSAPLSRLSGPAIVDRYEARVGGYRVPPIVSFLYTVEQAGQHGGLSQQHRIYRSGFFERDETIEVQGNRIKPRIRIYRNKTDAYALSVLAPRRSGYAFTFAGAAHDGGRLLYLFHTTPSERVPGYAVTDVAIDAQTFLPVSLDFVSSGAVLNGRGHLRFGAAERAWVVLDAEASARAGKRSLRERITFSDYHFPSSLPPATFGNLEP